MAYLVDWDTRIITIPKSDLISLGGSIYKLDLEECHKELRRLEWEFSEGLSREEILEYTKPKLAGGVYYARFVLLQNGYTVTFEDGQHAVNFDGANTNIHDYTNVNQVSVRPNNSAGLQDLSTLLASAYQGRVVFNSENGQSGQSSPIGTLKTPSDNIQDAVAIADFQGVGEIYLGSSVILEDGDNVAELTVSGASHSRISVDIRFEAQVNKTIFANLKVSGILDGDSELNNCVVRDLVYFYGHIHNSAMAGTITLGGAKPAKIHNCNMLDFETPFIVDCGGFGQDAVISSYEGFITIKNLTGDNKIGISFKNGTIIIDETCTGGNIVVMGNYDIIDNSGVGCIVNTDNKIAQVHNIPTSIENATATLTQDVSCP